MLRVKGGTEEFCNFSQTCHRPYSKVHCFNKLAVIVLFCGQCQNFEQNLILRCHYQPPFHTENSFHYKYNKLQCLKKLAVIIPFCGQCQNSAIISINSCATTASVAFYLEVAPSQLQSAISAETFFHPVMHESPPPPRLLI